MKKAIILISLTTLVGCACFSQKHDYNWVIGYHGQNFHPIQNNMILNFGTSPFGVIPLELQTGISIENTAASISDKEGNLLFYTNGISVYGADHEIIENGDSISPIDFSLSFYDNGLTIVQGVLILPYPANDSLYYIFHEPVDWNVEIASHIPKLYYSLVNTQTNNGNGRVVGKNYMMLEDTLIAGKLTATRHANGRDWWLITGEEDFYTNVLYRFLVTPDSVINMGKEDVGPGLWYDAPSVGNAHFTPDGTKYIKHDIRFDPWNAIDVYGFDRCSGEFSHLEHIELKDTSFLYGGSAVSPDSRYLYSVTNNVIYQFDLTAGDIGSTKTVVAEYDGYMGLLYGTIFGTPQLAPDGSIFITTVSDTIMHRIRTPNHHGAASHVAQHSVHLPKVNQRSIPNFPNYRLGPLDGSPCDTLGLDNRPLAGFTYFAEELTVTFSDNSYYRPEEWEWDFGDGNGSTERNSIHEYDGPGEYYVCLTVRNEIDEDTYCRWIEVDTMMVVGVMETGEQGKVAVFPNPAHGQFNLQFDLPGTGIVTFSLYDVAGRKVKTWDVPGGKGYFTFPLFGVDTGLYFWRVESGGRFLGSGKVMVKK